MPIWLYSHLANQELRNDKDYTANADAGGAEAGSGEVQSSGRAAAVADSPGAGRWGDERVGSGRGGRSYAAERQQAPQDASGRRPADATAGRQHRLLLDSRQDHIRALR